MQLSSLLTLLGLAVADPQFCNVKPDPIPLSQPLEGPAFIGAPSSANPLHEKFWHEPKSSALHIDAGNTRTVDYPGPTGWNLTVTNKTLPFTQSLFDFHDSRFVAYGGGCNGSDPIFNQTRAFALIGPDFEILDAWQPPAPYTNSLSLTYLQVLMEKQQIVLSSPDTIFILQKCGTKLDTIRTIDLKPTLGKEALLNALMDAVGNVWFSNGGIGVGVDAPSGNTSLVGYVDPAGKVNRLELGGFKVENGFAVNNDSVIFSLGPVGPNNRAHAVGYTAKVTSSPDGVRVLWNSSYDAGSDMKYPGALTRGSGTTPSLLGHDFVAINDNADNFTNMVIFSQNTGEQICKLPMSTKPGKTDNCPIVHWDGTNYGVLMQNQWNAVPLTATSNKTDPAWKDGWKDQASWNNNTVQTPGIQKFFVAGDGSGCHLEWTNDAIMTTDPVLSTQTGLLYGYEQSVEMAASGLWVWYVTAIDWMTGKTVWKVRTGAGGAYNNFYQVTFLGPDGTVYQGVTGGLIEVRDG